MELNNWIFVIAVSVMIAVNIVLIVLIGREDRAVVSERDQARDDFQAAALQLSDARGTISRLQERNQRLSDELDRVATLLEAT